MRIIISTLLLLLTFNLTAQDASEMYTGTENPEARENFVKGIEAAEEGNLKGAVKFYKKAIKADPKFVEAYDNTGIAYRGLGDMEEAIFYYKASLRILPEGTFARQNLALVYLMSGNQRMAIKEYTKYTELHPESAEGYYGLAQTHGEFGDFDKALENILKAVDIYEKENSPYLGDGYYITSIMYYEMDSNERAQEFMMLAQDAGKEVDEKLEKMIFKDASAAEEEEVEYTDKQIEDALKLEDEEDYRVLEKAIINWSNWYLNTPMAEAESDDMAFATSFILAWTTGSPYVSIEVGEAAMPFTKCGECLIAYMAAWTTYTLETGDEDPAANTAHAVKETLDYYYSNKKKIGKKKEVDKLVEIAQNGELDDWIKSKTN